MTLVIETAALSAFFKILFQKIGKIVSPHLPKFAREKKVIKKINKWKETLQRIKAVLEDAEEKQLTNPSVKMWLNDLQDLSYDVDDILDDFATEILQRQLKVQAITSKAWKRIQTVTTYIDPCAVIFNSKMVSKMKKITTRFEEIEDQKNKLGLTDGYIGLASYRNAWRPPPSTSLLPRPVYGREEDKTKILKLLKDDNSDAKFGVIPIVGMGGLGKTTLTQLVYNDDEASQYFDLKAWVHVSDQFDIIRISKAILQKINSGSSDPKELDQVQVELKKALSGKKFLIVLDNVWNEDYKNWEDLCSPFLYGAQGSKVIVTTRETVVARMIERPIECHITLDLLSDEDCWSVFIDHAFDGGDVAHQNLEVIRAKVINRCDGLPLAARTLGGLLRSKPRNHWVDVLKSNIWNLQGTENDVLPVLRLSYYHLPSQLKRCFAYCAIFPKDYEFEMKELVLLWMAEGLIEQRDDRKHMEVTGEEYFEDLLSRSLFQSSSTGRFVMHDRVNDLAQFAAGDTCFRLEDDSVKEKARHFSYIPGRDRIERFESFLGIKRLRTFMPLSLSLGVRNYLAKNFLSDLLPKLRCLRTLSFRYYSINELPDSIGDLKHLRYLDLSYTPIVTLPKTVTSLCNLQTMLLEGCRYLKELPSEMQNLEDLRHLDIEGVDLAEGMPIGIEELISIQTLSNFVVGKDSRKAGITALMNLKFLRGALCISGLENVSNASDLRGPILTDKEGIDDLVLTWTSNDAPEESLDKDVLDKLKPHGNLKNLTIMNYGGTEFPSWVGGALFHNVMRLKLENCKKCTTLPNLGLLSSLKNLVIKGFSNVKTIDGKFSGGSMSNSNPFSALETLQFEDMDEWEEWNICGVEFLNLRELSVVWCPKLLVKLPSHLPLLEKLQITACLELVVSFQSLPLISDLKIIGCKKVELSRGCSSPNYMFISQVSFLFPLEEFMHRLRELKRLRVGGESGSLHYRSFHSGPFWEFPLGLPHFVVQNEEFFQKGICAGEIEILELGNSKIPEKLFISFTQSDFSSRLKVIRFYHYDALASLPVFFSSLCLEELEISSCESLISIGSNQLPPTLKRLEITYCKKLQSLLNEGEASSSSRDKDEKSISCDTNSDFLNLEYLIIWNCESLMSLGHLPASLKYLEFDNILGPTAAKLESIAASFDHTTSLESIKIDDLPNLKYLPKNMYKLTNLHEIAIYNCPELISFPEGGLPTAHLKNLHVENCKKLEALPDNMQSLTSLQELYISSCPSITSIPQEGFPINLTLLILDKVKFCKPLFEWGLDKLTSLKHLRVTDGCSEVVSFPQMKLPTSLAVLSIEKFPNLKYLSTKGFESLTSLKYLEIRECPKLASFPKNGLPPSLLDLVIRSCPLLQQKCQKGKGRESLAIARIPSVSYLG